MKKEILWSSSHNISSELLDNWNYLRTSQWRRLFKNIGRKGGKVINAWAFLNYWGYVPGLDPKVYAYGTSVSARVHNRT